MWFCQFLPEGGGDAGSFLLTGVMVLNKTAAKVANFHAFFDLREKPVVACTGSTIEFAELGSMQESVCEPEELKRMKESVCH